MIILSLWRDSLKLIAKALGIFYPPSALFIVGSIFILAILLHFSMVISSFKTEQQKLAQRSAILDLRLEQLEKRISEREEGEKGDGEMGRERDGSRENRTTGKPESQRA